MAKHISPSLAFVELTTLSGETVVTPLAFPDMAWLGSTAKAMARRLGQAMQTRLIDEGEYLDALRIANPEAFERIEIDIDFPAGRDPSLQPAGRYRYISFQARVEGERGLGFVPALGVVALAGHEGLQQAVIDAIRLEHRRLGRLSDTWRAVAAHWYDNIELVHMPVDLVFHTAEELRRLDENRAQPLLAAIGRRGRRHGDSRARSGRPVGLGQGARTRHRGPFRTQRAGGGHRRQRQDGAGP